MPTNVQSTFRVNEQTTSKLTGQLVDQNGAGIPTGTLTAFTLTLYNDADGSIINLRNGQDVLNTNNVTVDSSGNVVWTIQPDDNVIVDDTQDAELHIALFQWQWGSPARKGKAAIGIRVANLAKV